MAQVPPLKAAPTPKGLPSLAGDLRQMVVTYLKQETLEPIKGLARYVAVGLAGSVLLSIGLVLLALSLLRALQGETDSTFDGNLSWAPYLIVLAACGLVAALAVRAIGAQRRRAAKARAS